MKEAEEDDGSVERAAVGDELAIGDERERYEVAEVLPGALKLKLDGRDAGTFTYEELRERNAVRCSQTMAAYYSTTGVQEGISVFTASMEAFIELLGDPARLNVGTRKAFGEFLQRTLEEAGRPELFGVFVVRMSRYFKESDRRQ